MPKPTKIVWVSRHPPIPRQLLELDRLWPLHDLSFDPRTWDGAREIVERFDRAGADEMVLVAPWTVMRAIVNCGIHPIYAKMRQVPCAGPHETSIGSGRRRRCYNFVEFERVRDLKLVLEPLYPKIDLITGEGLEEK